MHLRLWSQRREWGEFHACGPWGFWALVGDPSCQSGDPFPTFSQCPTNSSFQVLGYPLSPAPMADSPFPTQVQVTI